MILSAQDKENSTNGRPSAIQKKAPGLKQAIEPKGGGAPQNHASKKSAGGRTPFSVSKLNLSKPSLSSSGASLSASGSAESAAAPSGQRGAGGKAAEPRPPAERRPPQQAPDAKAAAMARPPAGSKRALTLSKPKAAEAKERAAAAVASMDGAMPPVHAMFDDSWREKQEETFTQWINFMFQEEVEQAQADAAESTYRAMERRRRDDRARWRVAAVMEAPETRQSLYRLDKEVKEGRLAMRKDRMVHTDVGMRDHLLQILLSVSAPCLRPVLECCYHEAIPRASPDDTVNLHRFLASRLTRNPDILAKFAINGACSELNTSQGFYAELNRFILLRFLQVVLLLERGKEGGAFDGCVFCNAESAATPHGRVKLLGLKSTRDMVARFSKEFLSGEGDVIRHLSLLGMPLCHAQTPLDDFDMTVRCLSADMRDGVRLTRLVERVVGGGGGDLTGRLRVPAISRLQKVYNVKVAVDRLKGEGLLDSGRDVARDIVDGNREETLGVLWTVMSTYQLPNVIAPSLLKEETARLSVQNARARRAAPLTVAAHPPSGLKLATGTVDLLLQWCQVVCAGYGHAVHNFTSSMADGKALCLLFAHYLPSVLPLDAIQPTRADAVGSTAPADATDADLAERYGTFSYAAMDRGGVAFAGAVAGERENLRLVGEKAAQIGGVPCVIRAADMVNAIPEEKTLITFVAHLAARLIELGKDSRAALTVQRNWRCVRTLRQARKYEGTVLVMQRYARGFLAKGAATRRKRAVTTLQSARRAAVCAREFARAKRRVVAVQSLWRMQAGIREAAEVRMMRGVLRGVLELAQERRERVLRRHAAATAIAAAWRGARLRARMQRGRRAVVALQAMARGFRARALARRMGAARAVQRVYKGYRQLQHFRARKGACVRIQAAFRGFSARRSMALQAGAAQRVQTWWRCAGAVRRYAAARARVVAVQSLWRMQAGIREAAEVRMMRGVLRGVLELAQERRERVLRRHAAATAIAAAWRAVAGKRVFALLKRGTIAAQSAFRGGRDRALCRRLRAAVRIQARYRGWRERLAFGRARASVVTAQSVARGWIARRLAARRQASALRIQSRFRCHAESRRYAFAHRSLVALQARWRGYFAQRTFRGARAAAVAVQKTFRAHRVRASFQRTRGAAVRLQSSFRRHLSERAYAAARSRVVRLQARWRGRAQRHLFLQARGSAATLQRVWRGMAVRRMVAKQAAACTKIQSRFRCHAQARRYAAARRSLVALQARWRGSREAGRFQRLRGAATVLSKVWRGRQVRLECRSQRAAIAIQRVYRGYRQLAAFREAVSRVVSIQAAFRGFSARRSMALQAGAAQRVQTWWRCAGAVRRYAAARARVVAVQSLWRMQAGIREAAEVRMMRGVLRGVLELAQERRERVLRRHAAATAIAAAWRGLAQRREVKGWHRGALHVQSLFRGSRARLLCGRIRACMAIQRVFRGFAQRSWFLRARAAAVAVQSVYRGSAARAEVARWGAGAIRVQSWWRRAAAVRDYAADRKDIVTVQSVWRMAIRVRGYAAVREVAGAAQRLWRGYVGRRGARLARRRQASAVTIQTLARKRAAVREYEADRARVVALQAWARGIAARRAAESAREAVREARREGCARRVQRWFRGAKDARAYARTRRAARVLQACWRGHAGRKALWASCRQLAKRAKEMRARIEEARRTVQEHMKLGNRTTAGLDVLLHSSSITTILKAAASLEVTTRWSEACARCVADLGAIGKLYGVIASCNRSKPELELAKVCITTLKNFTQYPSLRSELASLPVAPQTLGAFISQNRERDEAGVLAAASLLAFLCQDEVFARAAAALQGGGGQPSPADHVRLALKSLKRKAPPPGGRKTGQGKAVATLESLLKKIERGEGGGVH